MTGFLLSAACLVGAGDGPTPAPTFTRTVPKLHWLSPPSAYSRRQRTLELARYLDLNAARVAAGPLAPAEYFNLLQIQRDYESSVEDLIGSSSIGVVHRYRAHLAYLDALERDARAEVETGRLNKGVLTQIAAQRQLLLGHFAKVFRRMA